MRTGSAIEIARAMLALTFPSATDEGLDRGAEVLVRWGIDGVGDRLSSGRTYLLMRELHRIVEASAPLEYIEPPEYPSEEDRELRWLRRAGRDRPSRRSTRSNRDPEDGGGGRGRRRRRR